jgi:hypothetical protein
MYTSTPFVYTTVAGTPAAVPVSAGSLAAKLASVVALNSSATANYFIKFYWAVNGALPTVGTTIPNLTVGVPATGTAPAAIGQTILDYSNPLTTNGQLYIAVTANQVATDTTAVGAGQGVVTLGVQL